MRFRGPRLIVDGEGRQSHGGPLVLCAHHLAVPVRQAWLGKNLDLQPIPLPFAGRREISTSSAGCPQGFWHKNFPRIGVSGRHTATEILVARSDRRAGRGTCTALRRVVGPSGSCRESRRYGRLPAVHRGGDHIRCCVAAAATREPVLAHYGAGAVVPDRLGGPRHPDTWPRSTAREVTGTVTLAVARGIR
jgi:hypothetical protein